MDYYIKKSRRLWDDWAQVLSPAAWKVLDSLLLFADRATSGCYPTEDRIARDCGLSRRTVVTAIQELEEWGWLEIYRGGSRGGKKNFYRLLLMGEYDV
jgi:biotin operon repressor